MIVSLRLQNFRSYRDNSFEVNPGVNIIVGPNASGKTNLLEAILVLARGSSYRARDVELVRFNQPWSRLDTVLADSSERTVKLVVQPGWEKTYEIGDKPFKRLTLQHTMPVVLFEPDHLQLLSGEPGRRRAYLDDLLEQTMSGYGSLRRQYRRALTQRNTLLKHPTASDTQLFPWNVRLSQLAGQIVRARGGLIDQLQVELDDVYKQLAQAKTRLQIAYDSRWPVESYETQLLKKLEADMGLDRVRGFTGSGPHREDFTITFNNRPATETASRGETRTAILALKILELKILEAARGTTPLLLLDDVFSELDGRRRHALTDFLAPYQTFITTTDADVVLQNFTKKANVIALR